MRHLRSTSIGIALSIGFLLLGCASITPQTASIMTPHELCLKYVGNNKTNARIAYAELSRRGVECDVANYQKLRHLKQIEFQRNLGKLQNSLNCLEGNYLCQPN
jgi:hypothetical protein